MDITTAQARILSRIEMNRIELGRASRQKRPDWPLIAVLRAENDVLNEKLRTLNTTKTV